MKKDYIREKVYLAAMLHDIGKFYQRADTGSVSNSKYLNDHCKTESTFCPQYNGRYTHKHVLWTAQFVEDFKSVFNNLVKSDIDDHSVIDNLENLAASHHLDKNQLSDLGKIIKKADCLSSGMDRSSAEAFRDEQDEQDTSWDVFKRKRMVSILETVCVSDVSSKMVWKHLPVSKLELSDSCFPQDKFDSDPDYEKLWEQFVSEFKFIQANTYKAFAETLLNLLLKYTSSIPSSTINFPDVSLYDHLKTTAALAVCLYDYEHSEKAGDDPFLLIGADFCGIQNYIYQIVSKYAGKNLKGRSFYVKLLSDAVVRYLLKELNLFQANVVYNSGGGFYIVAPNTKYVSEKLHKSIQTIESRLFESHGTSIYVAIDSTPLTEDALMHRDGKDKLSNAADDIRGLGVVWKNLFLLLEKKKFSKFSGLISSQYSTFFTPSNVGGENVCDSITGEEILQGEVVHYEGGLKLKDLTYKQIKLGEKLRETDIIVIKEGEPLPYWRDKVQIEPSNLGFVYYMLHNEDVRKMKEQLRASADEVTVVTLNGDKGNCDFLHSIDGVNNIYSIDFYGGNEIDRKNAPTFEQMCENENFSRMGVLRMDVDNLGYIFQQGIKPELSTLSRYAALSRSFDFFFSGYLNTIWRETHPDRSFIVYSGGDDVFIVGSWDVVISLAERIRLDFKEFCCDNPNLSLSGGIAIIQPKYPIMKGAQESEIEERNAKEHVCLGNQKNSISFMSMPLNWDEEYPAVAKLKDTLCRYIGKDGEENGRLPKSFLSKLMSHYANSSTKEARICDSHKIEVTKTYWMLTYDLSRLKDRVKDDEEVQLIIDNCIKEVCNKHKGTLDGEPIRSDYHPLELWTFAARWAELEYRKDK